MRLRRLRGAGVVAYMRRQSASILTHDTHTLSADSVRWLYSNSRDVSILAAILALIAYTCAQKKTKNNYNYGGATTCNSSATFIPTDQTTKTHDKSNKRQTKVHVHERKLEKTRLCKCKARKTGCNIRGLGRSSCTTTKLEEITQADDRRRWKTNLIHNRYMLLI